MDVPDLAESILAPARLLVREARHWLPIVAALAMVAALPGVVIQTFAPEALSLLGGWAELDFDVLLAGLSVIVVMWGLQLILQLVGYMLVFVVLADLTAGRRPDLLAGLRRLASWRLQGVWLLAALFEQTAIDLWFVGGAFLLVPCGLVTIAAYEEATGFQAFSRSFELGTMEMGPARPGVRIAVAVTLGFAVGLLVSGLVSLASCVASGGGGASPVFALLSGNLSLESLTLPAYGWTDAAAAVLLAPLGMLPTVYMMATQQVVYWQARRLDEVRPRVAGAY